MCLDYTGKTVSPCMSNYCSHYRLLLSIAAYVNNLMEEATSVVMDFNHHSTSVATCQSTRVRPSLCHTYNHPNKSDAIVQHTSSNKFFGCQRSTKSLRNILIQLDKSRYLNPVNVSEENVFLVFDTAHDDKGIQTFP